MNFPSKPSSARTSLYYITAGALIIVWTAVWFIYLWNNPSDSNILYYVVSGLMASGIMLLLIGVSMGQIGRAARPAEPLPDVVQTVVAAPSPVAPSVPIASQVQPGITSSLSMYRPSAPQWYQSTRRNGR